MPAPGVAQQPPVPEGAQAYNKLIASGFSKQDADGWAQQQNTKLLGAGYTPQEINTYWGQNQAPNGGLIGDMVRKNLAQGQPRVAQSPMDYLEAGWQNSDLGLMVRGKMPDVVDGPGQSQSWTDVAMTTLGQAGGDIPFSVAGAIGGGKVGAMVPGPPQVRAVTTAYGVGAGAAATPEAVRQSLMLAYRSGEAHNAADFMNMTFDAIGKVSKAGVVGGFSNLIGGQVGGKILSKTGSKILSATSETATNAAAYSATASAMEGKLPDAKDFTAGMIVAIGIHGGTMVQGKFNKSDAGARVEKNLQDIYEQTGIPPWEAVARAKADPHLMEELTTQDIHGNAVLPSLQEIAGDSPPRPGYKQPALYRPEAPTRIAAVLQTLRGLENSAGAAKAAGISENDVVSPKGAVGTFQIMPGTARQYGFDPTKLHDPDYNRAAATKIVTDLYKRFDGDEEAIAIAYNAGPGRAAEFIRAGRDPSVLPRETQAYIARLAKMHGGWKGSTGGEEGDGAPGEAAGAPRLAAETTAPVDTVKPAEEASQAADDASMTTDEAHEKLQAMIGEPPKPESLLDPDRLYRQVLSELGPAKEIDRSLADQGYDKKSQMGTEDWFRQTYASDARAGAFVRWGIVDPETRTVIPDSPSFMKAAQTVKDAGGNLKEWQTFMLAQRTIDAAGRGIKTGFDPAAAAQIVSTKSEAAKYAEGTAQLNKVLTGALDYAHGKGLYSQAQVDAMVAANPTYISMKRVMDAQTGSGPGKNFRAKDPLSRLEGSDRQVIDPLAATIANLHSIVANADRNEAIGFVVKLAEGKYLGDEIKKVDSEPVELDANKAIAQPSNGSGLRDNQFAYFRDGQRETWEATDPALAKLIRGADSPGEANLISKVFETFAGLQRAGIVAAPDFPLRVMVRHQFQAFIADPLSPPPFITWLRGAADVIGQTQTYKDWVTNGGAGVSLQEMDTNYLKRDFHDLMASTGGWEKTWNAVQHPIEALRLVSERLDAAARTGYFKMAQAQGIEPVKAATMGRTAYLDYSEKGTAAFMQQWSKIVPFFRPHLLGLKQLGDAWSERPVSTSVKMMAMVTLPAVTLYALNYLQDQDPSIPEAEKYRNLPRWERDTMFILPQIAGVRIKIPMPKAIGVPLGGLPTRFLDWSLQQDPHAFDDFAKNWLHDTMPNVIPALATPVIEQATNSSFFTGKPLVPDSLKQMSGDMQYTQATSEPAKAISRVLGSSQGIGVANVSPIVLENYVRGWAGTMGTDALKALDAPLKTHGKPWEVTDIPFLASFLVRHPEANAQPIQDFYTEYDKFKTAHADFTEAMKRAKSGEPLNMAEINAKSADPRAFANLASVASALHMQQAVIQATDRDEKMTVDEKRQTLERVYNDMITTAKVGSKAMDDIESGRPSRQPPDQAPTGTVAAPAQTPSLAEMAGKQ